MGLSTVETGWLAVRLMPAGAEIGLSMLGVATALGQGNASDDEISGWYEACSRSSDPVYELNQFYRSLEAENDFLSGHLRALAAWTEEPSLESSQQAVDVATVLREVSWSTTEPNAGGDVLGSVKNHMNSIAYRRTQVFDYVPIGEVMAQMLATGQGLRQMNSFVDAWCGSGTRAIAMAMVQRVLGHDTAKMAWRLNDPAPMAVALAALNMVGYGIGPDVKLACDREWSEVWATSTWEGRDAATLRTLPPELAIEAPALRRKKLGR